MREKETKESQFLWPSRLAIWSCRCIKVNLAYICLYSLFFFIAFLFFSASESEAAADILWAITPVIFGLFILGLICTLALSFVALLGMSFYRFKIPKVNLAAGIFTTTLIFSIALYIFCSWVIFVTRKINCLENLRSIEIALFEYKEKNGHWPDKENWNDVILPYLSSPDVLKCRADKIGPCSYAMNENIPNDTHDLPTNMVLIFESNPGWNNFGGADDVVMSRHRGFSVCYCSEGRDFVEPEDANKLQWTTEASPLEQSPSQGE